MSIRVDSTCEAASVKTEPFYLRRPAQPGPGRLYFASSNAPSRNIFTLSLACTSLLYHSFSVLRLLRDAHCDPPCLLRGKLRPILPAPHIGRKSMSPVHGHDLCVALVRATRTATVQCRRRPLSLVDPFCSMMTLMTSAMAIARRARRPAAPRRACFGGCSAPAPRPGCARRLRTVGEVCACARRVGVTSASG